MPVDHGENRSVLFVCTRLPPIGVAALRAVTVGAVCSISISKFPTHSSYEARTVGNDNGFLSTPAKQFTGDLFVKRGLPCLVPTCCSCRRERRASVRAGEESKSIQGIWTQPGHYCSAKRRETQSETILHQLRSRATVRIKVLYQMRNFVKRSQKCLLEHDSTENKTTAAKGEYCRLGLEQLPPVSWSLLPA
jgi:hypothetical protein